VLQPRYIGHIFVSLAEHNVDQIVGVLKQAETGLPLLRGSGRREFPSRASTDGRNNTLDWSGSSAPVEAASGREQSVEAAVADLTFFQGMVAEYLLNQSAPPVYDL
jgi:hypothetical protein